MLFGPTMAIRCPATSPCADNPAATASILAVELGPGHGAAYWSRLNQRDALGLGRRVSPDKISEIGLQLFRCRSTGPH